VGNANFSKKVEDVSTQGDISAGDEEHDAAIDGVILEKEWMVGSCARS
jgi:hypothetical protein